MTPEQALQLLDQAVAIAPLNRQQHIRIQQAVEVINNLIAKEDKSEKEKDNTKK